VNKRFLIGTLLLSGAAWMAGTVEAQPTYVGSDECKRCHEDHWNFHRVSGHPYKLHTAADARTWAVPLPDGYDWDDIGWVIGGYRWKVRYMDTDGYIITSIDPPINTPGSNQYNIATGTWSDYHAGEVKQYDCGACHTTGYDPAGVNPNPGIVGTWEFEGIQCERCHGAGSDHVAAPSSVNITVDDTAAACGQCHVRGVTTEIPASGGFIRHHEQYNELLASPHMERKCVDCHNPHKRAGLSITTQCVDCHTETKFKTLGKRHTDREVGCVDCHMPKATKSATTHNTFTADIRTHLFKITLDKNATMFNELGTLANGEVTVDFACLGCHYAVYEEWNNKGKPQKALKWARKNAKKIHK